MRSSPEEAALGLLARDARTARSDPAATEAAVLAALAAAPWSADVRLGAYRFYFYTHRYDAALPQAEALLAHAARALNLPADWRAVTPQDAAFTAHDSGPGLYLQALIAVGYCQARLGAAAEAEATLAHAQHLDPTDRFGAGVILRAMADEDDDADAPHHA